MKKLLALVALLFATSSIAASVKINSFYYVRTAPNNTYNVLAELCGNVSETELPAFVKLEIDYNGNNPGSYSTVADDNGNFCLTVITYRGQARASVIGQDAKTTAKITKK